jgi:hypothetical protein
VARKGAEGRVEKMGLMVWLAECQSVLNYKVEVI